MSGWRRPATMNTEAALRRQMRNQGYADGYAGRSARFYHADYQQSWRRGREAAEAVNGRRK